MLDDELARDGIDGVGALLRLGSHLGSAPGIDVAIDTLGAGHGHAPRLRRCPPPLEHVAAVDTTAPRVLLVALSTMVLVGPRAGAGAAIGRARRRWRQRRVTHVRVVHVERVLAEVGAGVAPGLREQALPTRRAPEGARGIRADHAVVAERITVGWGPALRTRAGDQPGDEGGEGQDGEDGSGEGRRLHLGAPIDGPRRVLRALVRKTSQNQPPRVAATPNSLDLLASSASWPRV